ncbi:unnamed protein product [Effrenium voratum]|uniref:Uncharacterized protein n=1 Tax=Effrenium voratum TaxID=2562239 RepID=A0AA36I9N1_9DINO|nr:unnamed protein product [Effrenium voratum]
MSFYNHAVFEVGPTRVNPVQDSNGWRERASIEACYTNRAAGCVCASPGPYRWDAELKIAFFTFACMCETIDTKPSDYLRTEMVEEETPEPVQPPPRRKGKVPKDFGKEILTAGEMQRQALRPWKGIQAAGIVINANQTKPPVLPSFEVPNGKQTPALSCARTGTPCFEQVEIERQKRQRAEEEVERLRAELRACRSCASSASSKSGSRPPSRQSAIGTPRKATPQCRTSRARKLAALQSPSQCDAVVCD